MRMSNARTAALGLSLFIIGCQGQAGPIEPMNEHGLRLSGWDFIVTAVAIESIRSERSVVELNARLDGGEAFGTLQFNGTIDGATIGRGVIDCLNLQGDETVWASGSIIFDPHGLVTQAAFFIVGLRDGGEGRDVDRWTGLMLRDEPFACEDPPAFSERVPIQVRYVTPD